MASCDHLAGGHGYPAPLKEPAWDVPCGLLSRQRLVPADGPGSGRWPGATREGGPVTSDDDWIAYLAGDTARSIEPGDRAELDRLRALLADPAAWEKPAPALENRVLTAVAVASGAHPSPAPRARSRRFRPGLVYTAFAFAAASLSR